MENQGYAVYEQYPHRFVQAFNTLELARQFIREHPELSLPIVVSSR